MCTGEPREAKGGTKAPEESAGKNKGQRDKASTFAMILVATQAADYNTRDTTNTRCP